MNFAKLTDQELRRYKNQITLGEIGSEGQEKIKNTKIIVIGAGGLGTVVLSQLCAIGAGQLGITDNDLVEEKNVHRQTLYGYSDLGKQKAIITKQKLERLNPDVILKVHNLCISLENIQDICHEYDLIIDATENYQSSLLIIDYCRKFQKPYIFGKSVHFIGSVATELPNIKNKHLIEYFKNGANENSISKSYICFMPGVIGSIVVLESLRIITKSHSKLTDRILKVDLNNYFFNIIE